MRVTEGLFGSFQGGMSIIRLHSAGTHSARTYDAMYRFPLPHTQKHADRADPHGQAAGRLREWGKCGSEAGGGVSPFARGSGEGKSPSSSVGMA